MTPIQLEYLAACIWSNRLVFPLVHPGKTFNEERKPPAAELLEPVFIQAWHRCLDDLR